QTRTRSGPGHGFSMYAGPSLCLSASGMVPQAPRRYDPVRRESAKEVSGHLSTGFREPGLAESVGGTKEGFRILDWSRRAHFSRGQSAYQSVRLLGVGDQ